MGNIFKIAVRNLLRYKRRTLLTISLITIGVVFVLVFISITGSFKSMIIGQITDSMLGHVQVHRRGYVASIDNLPLNLNPPAPAVRKLENILRDLPEVEAYSPRIKFGGMFSNFTETTNIRLNGVYPEQEFRTVPLLPARIKTGSKNLKKGEIWVPELLARGMGLKIGDPVVVVATNKDGSVNGKQFIVSGILESATGPGGRDGYIHLQDALEVLRLPEIEIGEMAIRIRNFNKLTEFTQKLEESLTKQVNPQGQPIFEVHSWEQLSPFYNIARMIEVMTFFIKLMLIAVVLISIMNVMIMAVYERIREIGTIAAIGTLPGKILSLFVMEGFCLGVIGAVTGSLIGLIIVLILNFVGLRFDFGMQKDLVLAATIAFRDLIVTSGIVILVAVIASLQPALKASRMEPIKALRHV
jgi:putative ABC transport system permease protein